MTLHAWIITMRGRIRERLCPELQVLRNENRYHCAEVERLRVIIQQAQAMLPGLKMSHRYVAEDDYYSCPLHPETRYARETECDCAATDHNKAVEQLITFIAAALKETK